MQSYDDKFEAMEARRKIDRTQFNTPEFKERLSASAKATAADKEYMAECALIMNSPMGPLDSDPEPPGPSPLFNVKAELQDQIEVNNQLGGKLEEAYMKLRGLEVENEKLKDQVAALVDALTKECDCDNPAYDDEGYSVRGYCSACHFLKNHIKITQAANSHDEDVRKAERERILVALSKKTFEAYLPSGHREDVVPMEIIQRYLLEDIEGEG